MIEIKQSNHENMVKHCSFWGAVRWNAKWLSIFKISNYLKYRNAIVPLHINVDEINSNKNLFNISQVKCLTFFAMLYISIMICNVTLTNRWVSVENGFVFGGAFVSPILFILGDIIAEIFSYKIARNVILVAFLCQTIFAIITMIVLSTPLLQLGMANTLSRLC